MNSRKRSRTIGACLLCLVTLAVLALGGIGLRGDEGGDGEVAATKVRVGVFESRAIAVAYAPSKYNTNVRDLQAEHDKAKAAGDTKKMAELEKSTEILFNEDRLEEIRNDR